MDQFKTALVTGGANRLGYYLSEVLLNAGMTVVVHYHGSDVAAQALLEQYKGRVIALQADLRDPDALSALMDRAVQALGAPVQVLVNNAAGFTYDNLTNMTLQTIKDNLDLNLLAPMILTQRFAAQCVQSDRHKAQEQATGLIVNILDQKLQKLTPEFTSYTIAKAGLATLTQTSAQGLAPHIRVNAIAPGTVLRATRQSKQHFDAQRAATPLQRGVNPDDIQSALRYLLDAHSVTGQVITVDSGQHLNWQTRDIVGVEQLVDNA